MRGPGSPRALPYSGRDAHARLIGQHEGHWPGAAWIKRHSRQVAIDEILRAGQGPAAEMSRTPAFFGAAPDGR